MAAVREAKAAVKESLLGVTTEPALSAQARATFQKYARQRENEETFMNQEDFVDAIAPDGEDYVSKISKGLPMGNSLLTSFPAQNQERAVCHSVSCCR